MRVYFVRHGQTVSNKQEIHQGHDDELNDLGKKQAQVVARRFRDLPIEVIISSDFSRARDTAAEIAIASGAPVETTELLRERKRPSSLIGKSYRSEEVMTVMRELEENRHEPNWHHSDEENHTDALLRAKHFLAFLEKRTEKNIVVVTHAAFMRFILTSMIFGEQATVEQFKQIYDAFRLANTGVSVCHYKDGLRGMYHQDTFWHIDTWNDHAHLKDITE